MTIGISTFGIKNEGAGSALYQYLAMLTGTLSIICSGMHYGWPSPSLPKLLDQNSTVHISSEEGSWIAVMPLVGAVCGSILGGFILDIIGRKKVVLFSCFPFFGAWIMLAYGGSAEIIYAARLIAGISDGLAFCALPMYLGEIANPAIRGSLGSSVSVTWIFGTMLINVIGSYASINIAAVISSVLPVLCLITFSWMPESPYYLIMKGNKDEARKSLEIFKGTRDVDAELERMCAAVKEQQDNAGRCLDLFTVKSNRKALYIMLGTRGFQQLCGTSAITFYAHTIFKEAGDSVSSNVAAIIYFAVQLTLCACCSIIVDKTGRRPLLIISIIGAGIALFAQGTYFYIKNETDISVDDLGAIPLVAMIAFVVVFSIGMQTIPILLLGELFPTSVKAFALSLADIYFSIVATSVSKFFQTTKDHFGLHVPFFAFTVFCVLGLFFIVLVVPETKGKTLEEIQEELRGNIKVKPEVPKETPREIYRVTEA